MRVAVVGAGLAGLAAAHDLTAAGHEVVVFEKSRGAGGRTSTRRTPHGRFDHGAPFLHDGEQPLAIEAAPALARTRSDPGAATAGPSRRGTGGPDAPDGDRSPRSSTTGRRTWQSVPATVGARAGNAPAKALAAGADLRAGARIGAIVGAGPGWTLADEAGQALGAFDAVLVTAPAPQAAELLPDPDLAARAASVAFAPCWSIMAAWDDPLGLPFTAAREGLAWAVAEAAKPGREPGERWVLQADAELSAAWLEGTPEEVARDVLARFCALCRAGPRAAAGRDGAQKPRPAPAGSALPPPAHLAAHLWRYARPLTPLAEPFLRSGTLLAAGDWCGGNDAGAALRSGRAAAASILSDA